MNKKYELTEIKKDFNIFGESNDSRFGTVKAGDLGGWIESEANSKKEKKNEKNEISKIRFIT